MLLFIHLLIWGCAGSSFLCRLFSSCSKQGLLSSCGGRTSHCGSLSCCRAQSLGPTGFSSCSMWTQYFWFPGPRAQAQQMWLTGLVAPRHVDLPRSGIKLVFLTLAGGVFTTEPPGKPQSNSFIWLVILLPHTSSHTNLLFFTALQSTLWVFRWDAA